MSAITNIPIDRVFRDSWLDPLMVLRSSEAEVIAYVHWTRPNHFGGHQNFYSAIGLLTFELPSRVYYLLGIIEKSSKRDPWGPCIVECGDQGASSLRWNHWFFMARPNYDELSAFAKAWDFDKRLGNEVVVDQFSVI